MTQLESQLLNHAVSSAKALQSLTNRLARLESRLTQLMLFQGMQTDGRSPLSTREINNVA